MREFVIDYSYPEDLLLEFLITHSTIFEIANDALLGFVLEEIEILLNNVKAFKGRRGETAIEFVCHNQE